MRVRFGETKGPLVDINSYLQFVDPAGFHSRDFLGDVILEQFLWD